ncbi:hypothetical protein KCP74_01265 [Salmonella enterica subsp. enterica]|nr:hypothetical protein KCP74_01265 [Salmonella enterica subsp. enterica]
MWAADGARRNCQWRGKCYRNDMGCISRLNLLVSLIEMFLLKVVMKAICAQKVNMAAGDRPNDCCKS